MQAMRENIGLTNEMILTIAESEKNEQIVIHQVFKDAVLSLVKTLFYNYAPFNEWQSETANRNNRILCYQWDTLSQAQPHQTVYSWERFKYGEERSAGFGISEDECIKVN